MRPADYQEVRRKLRERGYLEGRIERFVLRDLAGPGGLPSRLLRSSLKAAVLGGPVLGALLAAAAVSVNRPLLGAEDALLLWVYFSVPAVAVLFTLDLAAALVAGALARRRGARPSDTLQAALLVGIPTLVYLVALWGSQRSPRSGQGGLGLAGDVAFLLAAAVVTFFAASLGGVVSLAGIVGRTGELPLRRRRPLALGVLLLALAAAALFAVRGSGEDPAAGRPPSAFRPMPSGRLVVLGIDGLDEALARALAARGALPALEAARAQGGRWSLPRAAAAPPPEVWTTLLTGTAASVHGVHAVGAERLPGISTPLRAEAGPVPLTAALRFLLPARTVPTSGAGRQVRTVWEVVSLARPVAAVGFWSTWPAETGEAGGYVVSDRALPALLRGAEEGLAVAPAALWPRLRARFAAQRAALLAEAATRFASLTPRARELATESLLIDGWSLEVLGWLLEDERVALGCAYLPGLDILRHRLLDGPASGGGAAVLDAQAALEGYGRWLDARVAPWLSPRAPGRVLVVADAGRGGTEGFVLAAGEGIPPGCRGPALDPPAVAPLALALAGFPSSKELAGTAPRACAPPDLPGPPVATYGRRARSGPLPGGDSDPELVERLKSLGYLR